MQFHFEIVNSKFGKFYILDSRQGLHFILKNNDKRIKWKWLGSGIYCISRWQKIGGMVKTTYKHFDNIIILRKKLEEAMTVVDKFGTDARSISRTLENIKDPEQVEKAVQTENVEKFVERNKQLKN